MSETQQEQIGVDQRVTRVLEVLLAYRRESWNELFAATGMSKHTVIRRRQHGGWTAAEVERLAEHFGFPVSVFYEGPDGLIGNARTSRFFRQAQSA